MAALIETSLQPLALELEPIDCVAMTLDFAGYTNFCFSHYPRQIAFVDVHTVGCMYQIAQKAFGKEAQIKLEGDCIKVYQPIEGGDYRPVIYKFVESVLLFYNKMSKNNNLIKSRIDNWEPLGFRCCISAGKVVQNYYSVSVGNYNHTTCELSGRILVESAKGQTKSVVNFADDFADGFTNLNKTGEVEKVGGVGIMVTKFVYEFFENDSTKPSFLWYLTDVVKTGVPILDAVDCKVLYVN